MSGQAFAGRIWAARCAAQVTLRDAAKRLGVHRDYLAGLECGTERPPSNRLIDWMAELYGADRDALYAAAGRVPPELHAVAASPEGIALLRTFAWRTGGERK